MTSSKITDAAKTWQLRSCQLNFENGPAIMGIVNVTPDSFSDGGEFFPVDRAVEHALRLEDAGAGILDIGGESTRPYSSPVSLDQELSRVVPVLERLSGRVAIPISIDTSKAAVAQAAIDLGAEIINDITGLEGDPEMVAVAAKWQVGVCAMHIRGTPQNMQDDPVYGDVVDEIYEYLRRRDHSLLAQGIAAQRICLDPGIGFGKTHTHNLHLLRNARRFLELQRPILIGHSRKGFVGKLVGDQERSRDAGTVGVSLAMADQGIQVLRVHDVAATVDALVCYRACKE